MNSCRTACLRNGPSKTYEMRPLFREKSLYTSIDKWARLGIILPHLSLCLWEVIERTDKEFDFFCVWWGSLPQGKHKVSIGNVRLQLRLSMWAYILQSTEKKFLRKKENKEESFYFLKNGSVFWNEIPFHSKRKTKSL